jgi:ATP-binding cassette subfamily B protein
MRHAKQTSPPLPPPGRSALRTIVSLLPYLWPAGEPGARLRVVLAGLCLLAAKIAVVYVPVLYSHIVDALAPKAGRGAAIAVPLALILGYGLVRLASGGFGELRDAAFASVQQRAVRRVALQTFAHLHRLSLRFHLDRQTGGLSRVIERGTNGIQAVLRLGMFNILPTLIEVLLVTAILWRLFDWRFALVTALAVGGYMGFTFSFTGRRVRLRRQMNEIDNEAQTRALDSLLNYETVKYFNNEAHEAQRFDHALARYERAAVRAQVALNMLNLGQSAIVATGLAVVMLMAARGIVAGRLTIGQFVLVNTYLFQLYQPLNFLGYVYREIRQGLVDMEQMFRLLAIPAEVLDRPGAIALPAHLADSPAGALAFEAVDFGYQPDRTILRGVSFAVPPGGTLAIVGPTGAGKSTIARLLFRFYDPTAGRVVIDGQDIRDLTQDSLRAAIGVVPQDAVLFSDSLRYNIAYGRPGATQEAIEHAARLAQIDAFIQRLPQGYDTLVGERGLKLSGGERQRVAIARTLLKDPRILILDEATSALDTRTEQDIQAALRTAARHRTTLVIAHRLSTVIDADRILVLDHGQVVECGPHAELLRRGGLYARMWMAQAEEVPAAE